MKLRKLQILESVARNASFTGASKELHIAQPAVSIAIRELEQELGATLLDRTAGAICPTAEGSEALRHARVILAETLALKNALADMAALASGEITLVCPAMLATYFLPQLLGPFLERFPGVRASIVQTGTRRIESMILSGEAEIGVVTLEHASSQLEVTPIVDEYLVACLHAGHPWARRKYLRFAELHDQPMVLYEQEYYIRDVLDRQFRALGVRPIVRIETNFLPVICNMIREGVGIGVGISMMAKKEQDIVGVPLTPRISFGMGIAYLPQRRLSRANSAFVDWLGKNN